MKPTVTQARKPRAFTIIELLTVMSIIVILIGLMVPALNKVRRYARDVQQKAQFNAINAAVELFNNEFDSYPPSTALDPTGKPYCGAMKLCEALMGWDLLGVHTNTEFRRDGLATDPADPTRQRSVPLYTSVLTARKGPFLPIENANAFRIRDIYGTGKTGGFLEDNFVLCDMYARQMTSANKTGMPILYYRADTASSLHTLTPPQQMSPLSSGGNIYNYLDNQELLLLGKPWEGSSNNSQSQHKLAEVSNGVARRFYMNTKNNQITTASRPFRADTFILISAGWDGEYGTADDISNFDLKYQETIPVF